MNLYSICICIVCLFEIHAEIEDYCQPEIVIEYVMQMDELDVKTSSRDQSQNQIIVNDARREEDDRMLAKPEIINETDPNKSRVSDSQNYVSARQIVPSKQSTEPSELSRAISRTEVVRQDVRKLKSVTLDRMGKIFKTRTPAMGRSLDLDTNVTCVDNYDEKASIKEKTNSLGRMLKLVDKDGSSRKLFARPRTGSLSRILRRHPHNEDNGVIDKPAEDTGRGIFSRMLNQLKGK